MSTDGQPVKVTVYLMPAAYAALEASAEREGISRTDALNRALFAWAQLTAKPGTAFTLTPGGELADA